MTGGNVTATRKPLLPITLLDSAGNRHTLRVILDTGFTGELLLPERYIRRLGLTLNEKSAARPATGEFVYDIPTGEVIIIWQGRPRSVQVLQLDSEPLLGMEFLWNHRITIDAVANGAVTVTPLQSEPAPE